MSSAACTYRTYNDFQCRSGFSAMKTMRYLLILQYLHKKTVAGFDLGKVRAKTLKTHGKLEMPESRPPRKWVSRLNTQKAAGMKITESQIHSACIEWLRWTYPDAVFNHSPNGGKRGAIGQRDLNLFGRGHKWLRVTLIEAAKRGISELPEIWSLLGTPCGVGSNTRPDRFHP